jgi:uncharacterized protein YyaL (SSP411 family)
MPNRLASEKSPYLLQHALNPVDWFPWGEEAFARARTEKKLIFLSIGYSTCHWCHVMERESFETERVAAVLNADFVSIKVDREERPDVDHIYMSFVQATTGQGGWPMSVWLTPDLKPVYGGTYFPPTDRYGRPGFTTVLSRLSELWQQQPDRLEQQAAQITASLRAYAGSHDPAETEPGLDAIAGACEQLARSFEPVHGGYGGAPKFPRPVSLRFMFRVQAHPGLPEAVRMKAREMNLFTLRKMAAGGMHDHVGGGFHRYSVDAYWHVPHYEKMLYDQAQLLESYLDAWQITGDEHHAGTARDIAAYVMRDLRSPGGGFYSAEDADSLPDKQSDEKKEGAFYVWTWDEVRTHLEPLGQQAVDLFCAVYGVEKEGNSPPESDPHGELTGQNTLIRRMTDAEAATKFNLPEEKVRLLLAEGRRQLFEVRVQRPRPHLDDKILSSWNGMMITALARAGAAFGNVALTGAALNAARFIREKLYDAETRTLYRSYREGRSSIKGFADDYAQLIRAGLELYAATADTDWLAWGEILQEEQLKRFGDAPGGFFSTEADDPHLILRPKEDYDGAEPSANSVSVENLIRLGRLLEREAWIAGAGKALRVFALRIKEAGITMPNMLCSLDTWHADPEHAVLEGDPESSELRALQGCLLRHYLPHAEIVWADGAAGSAFFQKHGAVLPGLSGERGGARIHLCRSRTCQLPVAKADDLERMLGA